MTGLKSVKYIQLDDTKGCLYAGEKRILIIPATFISLIVARLLEVFGQSGARVLVYNLGENFGEGYVETLLSLLAKEKTTLDNELLLREVFAAISMEAGWGRIEVKELDLKKGEISVKIFYSPSGQLIKGTQYTFEKGILAGAYKKIIGQEIYFQVIEEKKEEESITLKAIKEIPKELLITEKMTLLSRQDLEAKVAELKRMNDLMIGRELKMREMKKEMERLRSQSNA